MTLSDLIDDTPGLSFEAQLHASGSEQPWETFNAAVHALAKHGEIVEVRQAGDWDNRFDIVTGKIGGVEVTLYGPRFRDERPTDLELVDPREIKEHRKTVLAIADELKARTDAHR